MLSLVKVTLTILLSTTTSSLLLFISVVSSLVLNKTVVPFALVVNNNSRGVRVKTPSSTLLLNTKSSGYVLNVTVP